MRVICFCFFLIRAQKTGLVLCYYEPVKHTDFPNQKAKGYLPLWMLSKLEADVSSATPLVSLQFGTDTFIFKGAYLVRSGECHASLSFGISQPASVIPMRLANL
jgi:hypothetical protein